MDEAKAGRVGWARPEKYYHPEQSKGLKTLDDNRFYHYSCDMNRTISTFNKSIFIGYQVTQTRDQKCAGSYLKFFKEPFDPEHFNSDTPYEFMFGHEYCGSTDQVQCTFNHDGKKHEKTQKIWTKHDKETHWFGIKLYANHTFEAYVDLKREAFGTIGSKWKGMKQVYVCICRCFLLTLSSSFTVYTLILFLRYFHLFFLLLPSFSLPLFFFSLSHLTPSISIPPSIPLPQKYNDDVKKPDDWDDREYIPDPDEEQPEDWDDQHRFVTDPNATKPQWWNETEDGEWIAPIIQNPAFKGKWRAADIKNPNYTGPWVSPLERNYEVSDAEWEKYFPVFRYVAIDDWQVESGTIFDNIIITDDPVEYEAFQRATYQRQKEVEKPGFVEDFYEKEISRKEKDKEKEDKKIKEENDRYIRTGVTWEIPSDDEHDEWYMEDI